MLFVEADAQLRQSMAHALREAGVEVVEAANAAECMDIVRSDARIDLMCTELDGLGSLDGESLAQEARALRPDLRIIVASAHAPEWPFRQTIDGFVGKPYDHARASRRIKAVLAEGCEISRG